MKDMLKRLGAFFLDIIQVVVFAVALFLFVYLLILQPHKIKGQSMVPNFLDAEFLLTDKVSYRLNEPKRGDVIVFKAPPDDKEEYIKRIIGLPGETVMVKNGMIYINNQPLREDYIPQNFVTNPGGFAQEGKGVTVPKDYYFVVGDNREHSYDSRGFGFINKSKITGRAWFVYWPVKKMGLLKPVEYSITP